MKYLTNCEFRRYQVGLKALRQYNKIAHKEIIFKVLPNLREGNLIGETEDNIHFKVLLTCDEKFRFVHGQTYLTYEIAEGNTINITSIEPYDTLHKLYCSLVDVRGGVPITSAADKFKMGLYAYMKEREK